MEQFNLTFPQKNIYMVEMLNSDTALNTIAGVFKINKKFNSNICINIIRELIRANDALRTRIIDEGETKQYFEEYTIPKIDEINMNGKSEKEIDKLLRSLTDEPIDIYKDSLVKVSVIATSESTGMIYFKIHHIVGDAWTLMLVINQLAEMYNKKLNKENIELTVPSYKEYIASEQEYLNSEKYLKDEEFWKEYMEGISEPVSLKEKVSKVTTKAARYSVTLSKEENDAIMKFAKENRVSPYTMFLAALANYVYRIKDVNEVVIGTPILNRSNFKEKNMLGCFISTIPMRIKITEDMKFLDLVKEIGSQTMSLFRHQKYPITKTIEHVHNTSEVKGKIYNMLLSYQNARANVKEEDGMSTNWIFSGHIQDDLEIHVMDMDSTGLLTINYDYLTDLFESIEIEYLHTRLMALIMDAIANVDISVEDIRIMSKEEENKILYEFNDTDMDYPKDKTVIELFEEQVEKTPNNIALVFEDKQMTYKELNEKANSLAHYLKEEKGIKEGEFIGILVDKSFELIISIIAVLKIGCCYVPLEKTHLLERKKFVLNNSNAKLLILDENVDIEIEKVNVYDTIEKNINNIKNNSTADSPNCVLYTSGTTGEPKGAIIIDRNIIKLVRDADYITFEETDKILQAASTSFDVSLFEIWGALLNGGSLHIIKKENLITPQYLANYLVNSKITVLWITSALFNQMIEYDAKMFINLRRIFTGGDVISISHVRNLMKSCPELKITNCYGPTECTTFTNTYDINKIPTKKLPIGKTISNTKGYVVDKKLRLLPLMTEGEYVLAGESVALEYINKPELTKEKFITNIFPNDFCCKRMYKTGDIVQMLQDGNIDFIGRTDNQVKIRGMRIELDEIKTCFMKIPEVKDCVVVIKDTKLGKAIYLYFTAKQKLDLDNVNKYLKENLLSHMVPVGIMQLDKLPINRNGKVDRKNLPEIKYSIVSNEKMTDTEKKLVKIVDDLFEIPCSINDNLFELGIDSLSIIRFITKIQEEFDIDIKISEIFKEPTINSIALLIDNTVEQKDDTIVDTKKMDILQAQKGIFMQYMMNTDSTLYNIPFEIELNKNNIDITKLKESIEKSIENHSNLFSSFDIVGGEIIQKKGKKTNYIVEVKNIKQSEYEKIKTEFVQPFDLLAGTLFKVNMYLTSSKIYILFNFHHIVFDGMSMLILLNEIAELYKGNKINKEKISFKEFVSSKKIKQRDIKYLKNMFEDEIVVNDMPYDRPRTKNIDNAGNKIYFSIDNKSRKSINSFMKKNNVTLNSIMQSVFMILLSKYMYNEDIIIGIADSGRNDKNVENLVGMLVKTMPYRDKIDWNINILDFIKHTQANVFEVLAHDSATYEDILKEISIPRSNNRNPLFDVMFVCQSINNTNLYIENQNLYVKEIKRDNSKFDFTFEVIPRYNEIELTLEYKTSLFDESTMQGIIKNYINILQYILKNSDKKLKDIEMISKEEKDLILYVFNDTKTEYPKDKSINQLFEEIVEKYPDKIAVVFKDEKLTYAELNKKANKLARLLLNNGIKKGEVVSVMIDKSSEYMIALLGILKSGGAYMPISQDMPEERINYVIQDTQCRFVVTTLKFDRKLDNIQKIYINFKDEKSDYFRIENDSNLNLDITSSQLSNVIYTSGTTGVPKGVKIIHRGMIRLLINTNLVSHKNNDVMLVSGSIIFDASGFEIWSPIFYGMTLHFIEKKDLMNPLYFKQYLIENQITVLLLPTPVFNQLVEYDVMMFKNVSAIYVGGEALNNKFTNMLVENCPNIRLVNVYGPAENSVISSFEVIDRKIYGDIPIGIPASNNKCFVIDKCEKICPLKVPGELYVGGDGLSLGYVNQPEVTKRKFIYSDILKQNIYKTGDLASWDLLGKLKFIGRVDTQVKIRGQRIELSEIQNKMLEIPEIKECVVVAKNNSFTNSKILVAYYTENSNILIDNICDYLRIFLPTFMIPNKFIKLSSMPLTLNGKIDIKNLPSIDIDEQIINPPTNELQTILLEGFKETLNIEKIGINTDFFEIGGDSLLAMKLIGNLQQKGINITYSDVFDCPTVLEMYNRIIKKDDDNNKYDKIVKEYDYSRINKLLRSQQVKEFNIEQQYNNILLIGATGYLGVHLLDRLINNNPSIKIYCLVREKNGISPKDRLNNILKYYFGSKYDNSNNIEVIDGDITSKKIIYDENQKEILNKKVDIVINSAAHVKHFGNENVFEEININGVTNLIQYCILNNKKFYHISTLSVSGNILEGKQLEQKNIQRGTVFDENSMYIGQNLNNVYAFSKYISERNILENILNNNLSASILRIGNLTGRYSDGKFQINDIENSFVNRIKTFKDIGFIPEDLVGMDIEFSPVDLVAEAIVNIITHENSRIIYHVYNETHVKTEKIINIMNKNDSNILVLNKQKSNEVINEMLEDNIKQNLLSGIIQDLSKDRELKYTSDIKISGKITNNILRKNNFEWPKNIDKYIEVFLKEVGIIDKKEEI